MNPSRGGAAVSACFLVLGVSACSSNDRIASTKSVLGADAGDGGPSIPGLSLLWRVVESGPVGVVYDAGSAGINATRNLPGVGGVEVCIDQHPEIPCATSAPSGLFTLRGMPAQQDLVLTCVKDGYVSSLRAIETAATDMDNSGAPIVTGKSGSPNPDLGIKYDDTKGALSFFTLLSEDDGGLVLPLGVTVTLSPSSGDGPFYTNAENLFERSATGTVGGLGFFFNLAPGNYELTFDDPHADCAPISFPFGAYGFPVPPTSVKFPIRAGFVTDQVGVLCTPKSKLSGPDAGARDR
jgi:hypothetical protein